MNIKLILKTVFFVTKAIDCNLSSSVRHPDKELDETFYRMQLYRHLFERKCL